MSEMGSIKRWYLEEFDPPTEAPFPREEYRGRWQRIRTAMEAAGIRCLVLTAPESICYITGHAAEWYQANGPEGWVPGSCAVLHVDHDGPIQFDDEEEVTLLRFTSVADDVRIGPGLGTEMVDFVVDELRDAGWLDGPAGVERRSYRPHPAAAAYADAALARTGVEVVDATSVARGVRRWKSPAELEVVRGAQRIADVGMAAARDAMAPGATERCLANAGSRHSR